MSLKHTHIPDRGVKPAYSLRYRLIIVVRNKRPIVSGEVSECAKSVFGRLSVSYGVTLSEWSYGPYYLDIRFSANPYADIGKLTGVYKGLSSRLLAKAFPDIAEPPISRRLWSRGYMLLTEAAYGYVDGVVEEYLDSPRHTDPMPRVR